jgi:hypothetical protein
LTDFGTDVDLVESEDGASVVVFEGNRIFFFQFKFKKANYFENFIEGIHGFFIGC